MRRATRGQIPRPPEGPAAAMAVGLVSMGDDRSLEDVADATVYLVVRDQARQAGYGQPLDPRLRACDSSCTDLQSRSTHRAVGSLTPSRSMRVVGRPT
jgi:hypothetical protein